jgi:alkanesulfonate monooxygenase SsuD/methylene tetrahydromethanopterin reductase-like flavin-dependent oxidoreductase (luciferase family)
MRVSVAFDGSTSVADGGAIVDLAESLGLDGVWSAEHLGLRDAIVPSAHFLGRTRRLEVGLIGLNPFSRHPGLLAMELSSLAELAPGRLRVQVGTGDPELGRRLELDVTDRPLATVEAFIEALRALFAGERLTAKGPGFGFDAFTVVRPHDAPRVDLMAMRPRMLALAGRVADGVSLSAGASRRYLAEATKQVIASLATAGRDRSRFRVSAVAICSVDNDLGAARRRAARSLAFSLAASGQVLLAADDPAVDSDAIRIALDTQGVRQAAQLIPDDVIDALTFVATPGTVDEALAAYAQLGLDELALMVVGPEAARHVAVRAVAASRDASGFSSPARTPVT